MAIQTPQQYYSNQDNWGGYQYISLKAIIDDMLIQTTDEDNYLKNTPRRILLRNARRGIQRLNREIKKTVYAIEITVPDSCYFALPQDYIEYIRVSVVDSKWKLRPLHINHRINIATGYLQDNNADILFDNNGYILEADSSNAYNKPYKKYTFCEAIEGDRYAKYGEFQIDERRGTILFDSTLADREVVIEYISDGLQNEQLWNEEVTIHKDLVEALQAYIYSETISTRISVPDREKTRALRRYNKLKHQLKVDALNLDYNTLLQMQSI